MLAYSAILGAIKAGDLVIDPFDINDLHSNSYDIHLGPYLATYDNRELDAAVDNSTTAFEIPPEGYALEPNTLYLAKSVERTTLVRYVGMMDGKSNTGKLGLHVVATATTGDVGFDNYWTFHLTTPIRTRIYAGMPIAQIRFEEVTGEIEVPYNKKPNAKNVEISRIPSGSLLWKNKFFEAIRKAQEAKRAKQPDLLKVA